MGFSVTSFVLQVYLLAVDAGAKPLLDCYNHGIELQFMYILFVLFLLFLLFVPGNISERSKCFIFVWILGYCPQFCIVQERKGVLFKHQNLLI